MRGIYHVSIIIIITVVDTVIVVVVLIVAASLLSPFASCRCLCSTAALFDRYRAAMPQPVPLVSDVAGTEGMPRLGRGDDSVGNPHRAQISQFELFELILLLTSDKQLPVEQFEATVSQSAVPFPPSCRRSASTPT